MQTFIFEGNVYRFLSGALYRGGHFLGEHVDANAARRALEGEKLSRELQEGAGINIETSKISAHNVAMALRENGEFKPTTLVCEGLKRIIESKLFIPSKTVMGFRLKEDARVAGKIEYVLRDGSSVLIDARTNEMLCARVNAEDTAQIVTMTENASNFVRCVSALLEG